MSEAEDTSGATGTPGSSPGRTARPGSPKSEGAGPGGSQPANDAAADEAPADGAAAGGPVTDEAVSDKTTALDALPRRTRIVLAAASAALGFAVWLPSVHLFFGDDAGELLGKDGLSPWAESLARRHLALWEEPGLREAELARMRASNAEWDFMGRTFLVLSLANVALREPAMKERALAVIDRIIDDTLRLEREKGMYHFLMAYARNRPFVARPARSVFLDGEIALMLGHRRIVEEKPEYAAAHRERVRLIVERMRRAPVMCLESYPDECWMFCNAVALAAVRMSDHLDGGDHSAFFREWIATARGKLVHPETGLLVSSFRLSGHPIDGPEGSTIWLVAHCLRPVDEEFARDQYERARRELGRTFLGFGYAREWPVSWVGPPDVDSGPTVPIFEANAGASGLAFVGAAGFEDAEFLSSLSASVAFAGFPVEERGRLRYCASNQVGDAVLLYAATLGPVWDRMKRGGE